MLKVHLSDEQFNCLKRCANIRDFTVHENNCHPWRHCINTLIEELVQCTSQQYYLPNQHDQPIRKNTERRTAHTIVSWPNPKQWVTIHNVSFHLNKCVTNFGHQKSSHVSFWQLCYLDFNLGRHMDWTSAWSVVVIRANKNIYMYIQSFYFLMSWILWSAIHDVILQKSVIKQSWGRLKSDQLLGFFWPLVSQPVGELVCWLGLNCLKTFSGPFY